MKAWFIPLADPCVNGRTGPPRRAVRHALGLLLVAWLPAVGLAAEVQRFATESFLPYIDATAPEGGYYPALVRRVMARQGIEVEFIERPWARAHSETVEGRFDGSFPYLRSAEREAQLLFSDPLLTVPSFLFVRRDTAARGAERVLREGRRTCYLRDSLLPQRVEAKVAAGELEVVRVDDMAQCFRMLMASRVDFVSAGVYNGRITLRRLFGDGALPIVMVGEALDESTLHLVWPRSDPRAAARREAFNAALRALREEGEVDRLRERLLPQDD